ncbi:prepilin-type N-terminal cleavage/methylation domain-containing protein [Microcoleus sp. FACHB-1515]|uniref:prepilin-type N-terminal cleavage/methylation domain-containing protein n=1 Tax=Cyanophyceae TaxID=3028117 RepID=UPI00168871F8|nr:prepilin-type N-terminal cleavage/methylation domain-containing protein [Microcoleus sp. FACHB-1515]MBD2091367.1 prepilin-type N-terminal cleavage/methylation domain-containing protein [Microcoleus sp. FACHB-1515]
MATFLLRTLKAIRRHHHSRQKGFTLIELLIVTLIAGGIVSGLMFLVVELLSADQRDASRNATQQDMQRSMEYISAELREAIFVYSGDQLSEIRDNIPASLSTGGSTPVLAFWKQAPLPSNVIAYCAANSNRADASGNALPIPDAAGRPIPCAAGHAYSLVVYSLNTAGGGPWTGKARITRYELRQYNNNSGQPTPVPGYVSPIDGSRNLFANWPLGVDGTTNRQTPTGTPTGAAVPLTDFVDDEPEGEPTCPSDNYEISPSNGSGANLSSYPYSFYACVYTGSSSPSPSPSPTPNASQSNDSIDNQEVILYLRGNGFGRPSINAETGPNSYRPTLTTRVFNRGTLDINPNN